MNGQGGIRLLAALESESPGRRDRIPMKLNELFLLLTADHGYSGVPLALPTKRPTMMMQSTREGLPEERRACFFLPRPGSVRLGCLFTSHVQAFIHPALSHSLALCLSFSVSPSVRQSFCRRPFICMSVSACLSCSFLNPSFIPMRFLPQSDFLPTSSLTGNCTYLRTYMQTYMGT